MCAVVQAYRDLGSGGMFIDALQVGPERYLTPVSPYLATSLPPIRAARGLNGIPVPPCLATSLPPYTRCTWGLNGIPVPPYAMPSYFLDMA